MPSLARSRLKRHLPSLRWRFTCSSGYPIGRRRNRECWMAHFSPSTCLNLDWLRFKTFYLTQTFALQSMAYFVANMISLRITGIGLFCDAIKNSILIGPSYILTFPYFLMYYLPFAMVRNFWVYSNMANRTSSCSPISQSLSTGCAQWCFRSIFQRLAQYFL